MKSTSLAQLAVGSGHHDANVDRDLIFLVTTPSRSMSSRSKCCVRLFLRARALDDAFPVDALGATTRSSTAIDDA